MIIIWIVLEPGLWRREFYTYPGGFHLSFYLIRFCYSSEAFKRKKEMKEVFEKNKERKNRT